MMPVRLESSLTHTHTDKPFYLNVIYDASFAAYNYDP